MKIRIASHYGMCFGVRDALRRAHDAASAGPVTVLGELVHNPAVQSHLRTLGVRQGALEDMGSSGTRDVLITAHGAADRDRTAWQNAGYRVTDTTCPLVHRAHRALAALVAAGAQPVVIGQADHVEVRGLIGDFPDAAVVLTDDEVEALPFAPCIGVVAQTTQPLERVHQLVEAIRRRHPQSEVRFRDTVCQPTKDRQHALEQLCQDNEGVVVVGGRHSNNTRQLVLTARRLGAQAWQVESAADLDPAWFDGIESVGVTAGTSTLDETVRDVVSRLKEIAASQSSRLPEVIRRSIARHFGA